MNRTVIIVILAWLAVFMQSSLAPMVTVWGLSPDIMAVLISVIGLTISTDAGILTGLLTGFLADCYRPSTMGLFTVSGVVSGFLAGALRDRVYRERALTQALVAGLLALVRHSFDYWGHSGSGLPLFIKYMLRIGLGGAVYTVLLSLLLIPLIRRMMKSGSKTTTREKWL